MESVSPGANGVSAVSLANGRFDKFKAGRLVSINQVTKVYESAAGRFVALAGVDLQVERGKFVSIIGKSGSGKSTLINMVTGIDRPTQGQIRVGVTDDELEHLAFSLEVFTDCADIDCFGELACELGPPQVGTVGRLDLHPNLVNVVPATATLTVDLRNTDDALLTAAEARKEKIDGTEVTITANAGSEGKLFGSVGPSDIARALAEREDEAALSALCEEVEAFCLDFPVPGISS